MGIDILSLCVLRGGATEILHLDAPAHHDLLRVFVVIQTRSPGPATTASGPLLDPVGTGFGRGFLSPSCPALATTPVPSTSSEKPRPAQRIFSCSHRSSANIFTKRTQLPLCVLGGSAVPSP